ncbi:MULTISPECIES: plasmid pRiA4b ORF-3 family protein [Xenorhabdus]|uniref:PRiA4b ORF-3-like protein n=1 Tax=Xenorhabdus ehlersii TaxID=290111 RepID=A0A2D0INF4_9GAMM|nr:MULTISPECIES: plasmid pRiA4b ORF-3 family protein [Xenorhabdus]MBC8951303.1 plasmid pRiA4b ORF-3-like family protein [Xenorhabdus sp. TS4]PHM23345.1 plasmid pRiA4b ORF-3-like family protein [Xenorhabdus ehlersii]RKE93390.1 pRiA4b ORF-3-like protein [Xenorhabdus ehlersii]
MKLTPEKLLSAIEKYAHTPEKQRSLTQTQIQWFSEPENVFLLISLVLTLPKEAMTEIGDSINNWLEVAIAEFALTTNKLSAETKQLFEEIIEQILVNTKEEFEINSECVLLCVSILKRNQFHIRTDITQLLDILQYADNTNIATFPAKSPNLSQLFKQFEIHLGIEFVDFFESGLSVVPHETLPHLLTEVAKHSWGMDALLLLTQYFEEPIALACAQALDDCPSSAWANLSYLQLVNLCARFNRHPAIHSCFKRWKKKAMSHHNKVRETAKIHELYVTHVDGNDCASMMMTITLDGQEYQMNMMLDFKSGIRESLLNIAPERTIPELIEELSNNESYVDFTPVSPDWLQQILPWILSVQQNKNTPLDLDSLYWLSQLPVEWTQPEAFELEHWSQKFGYQADPKRQDQNRLGMTMGSSLILSWLAPEECLLKAKKPRDLLKLYYYANRELFTERLTYSASIEQYRLPSQAPYWVEQYLDLAYALRDPALNRKKFALFDTLSELSFEYFYMEQEEEIEPQGLVLKVSLLDATPAVWRRLRVSNQLTLNEFHEVIQNAMGWENAHLFRFNIAGIDIPEEHYDQMCIGAFLFEAGDELNYQYDFGDDWFHQITVEKVQQKDIIQPEVTAGNGICPAEDSGGIWNWNYLLKLRRKKLLTEDEAEQLEFVGLSPTESLEPFDKQQVNKRLKAFINH